jgi:hypothetical protein
VTAAGLRLPIAVTGLTKFRRVTWHKVLCAWSVAPFIPLGRFGIPLVGVASTTSV